MKPRFLSNSLTPAFIAALLLTTGCGGGSAKSTKDTQVVTNNIKNNGPTNSDPSIDNIPRMNLKVLSYNAYLLPADNVALATSDQREYFLPDSLARTGADIIILQEVWTEKAQNSLKTAMQAKGYQGYLIDSKSSVPPFFLGNGLMIFAKNNLKPSGQPEFQPWKENAGFDKYAKKGVLRVPFTVNGVGKLEVYSAHTSFLPWDGKSHDYNYAEKDILLAQIRQLTEWARLSNANVKILGADLNTAPFVWDRAMGGFDTSRANGFYDRIRQVFDDPFAHIKPQCAFSCDTWDNDNNNLLAQGLFGSRGGTSLYDPEPNARYDYVMFAAPGTKVIKTGTAMHENFNLVYNSKQLSAPLSDHYAIYTELAIPLQRPL